VLAKWSNRESNVITLRPSHLAIFLQNLFFNSRHFHSLIFPWKFFGNERKTSTYCQKSTDRNDIVWMRILRQIEFAKRASSVQDKHTCHSTAFSISKLTASYCSQRANISLGKQIRDGEFISLITVGHSFRIYRASPVYSLFNRGLYDGTTWNLNWGHSAPGWQKLNGSSN